MQGSDGRASSISDGKGEKHIEDEQLIDLILSGDKNRYRDLVEKYRGYVFQLVYSILRHPKDTEDTMQDVFIRLYVALPDYQRQGFKTWLTRIAVNKAIDRKRQLQRSKERLSDKEDDRLAEMPGGDDVERDYFLQRRRSLIMKGLNEIPPNYREVLHAYYIEEKTYKEIAVEHGLEVKSVESRLYRAKKWARERWREEDFE